MFTTFKPLHVGDASRGFKNEFEIVRNLLTPGFKDSGFGNAKESIINFHRAEVFAIKTKHFFVGDVLGIKGAFPFLIRKAAGANVEVHITSKFRIHLRRNISELIQLWTMPCELPHFAKVFTMGNRCFTSYVVSTPSQRARWRGVGLDGSRVSTSDMNGQVSEGN